MLYSIILCLESSHLDRCYFCWSHGSEVVTKISGFIQFEYMEQVVRDGQLIKEILE